MLSHLSTVTMPVIAMEKVRKKYWSGREAA
jgi:hypothetical protein